MKTRRTRNPSFPVGLVVGAVAGAAALAWWATRQSAIATTQALVGGAANAVAAPITQAAPVALAYAGDVQGRVLTAAEAAAMGLGVTPLDHRRASLTAALQQAQDATLSPQTREAAARLAAQLQETLS